ncbi:asparagine synthase-related protein [Candidatus Nitrosotenuis cloacae]|uniref:asparagine synthase-related protein n=1 Tax=Candidatus Nitrosotenuis cloacae TaxID=1603555 RepID=UPI0022812FD5|nr:asparagine synthase-related protein [Candidatus Nitrosotenuis cloacae]
MTLNPDTVKNILTLRYDSSQKPILPKMEWKNLVENNIEPSTDIIEKSIQDTIRNQLGTNGTKNVSIALSGGVDSTLVLASLRKTLPNIRIDAVSIKFANSVDETKSAAKIAEHFGANHHIIELDNYLSELPKAISIIKLPFWDIHWYYVVKKAYTLSKYLASGDGGDEVFGGYTFRYKKFLSLTTDNSTVLEKVKAYLECHGRDRVPDQEMLFGHKTGFTWESIYDILIPYFDNNLPRLTQVLLADYNGKLLYNFSPVNTALHRHFDMESITPLLSTHLISYVMPLPNKFKYDSQTNVGKLLLRVLLQKYHANSLISEEKLGFNVNTINLWHSHGKRLCEQYLLNSRIVADGWISQDWIDKYLNKTDLDVRYVNKFLGLLAFEVWYRLYITNEIKETTTLD